MALQVAHPLQLPLGVSEFRNLREDALVYLDKVAAALPALPDHRG